MIDFGPWSFPTKHVNGLPVTLMQRPDRSIYMDELFTGTWRAILGMDGLGDANFDIPATGANTSGGLRVFFEGALAGAAGAGFTVSAVRGAATAVAVDVDARTVVVTLAANATLGQAKTAIDADARLTSRYYDDGVAANAAALVAAREVADGHAPRDAIIRVVRGNHALIYIGTDAPDSDIAVDGDSGVEGVTFLRTGDNPGWFLPIPAGMRAFIRRAGNANVNGSIELWK